MTQIIVFCSSFSVAIHIFYIFSFAYDKSRHTLSQKENAKNPYKIKVSGIFAFSTKQDKSHIFIIKYEC